VAYKLQTRVTRILGTKYPLVMGTMGYQSTPAFVAAAAKAAVLKTLSLASKREGPSLCTNAPG
jgi:NAD(P)H-dependent flavin oxidoreductase YrpB (nitropropane dioxygenase family)